MFENYRMFKADYCGRPLTIETGRTARLCSGACFVRFGDTTVHVAVAASDRPHAGAGSLPLTVDYEEKQYAAGQMPAPCLENGSRTGSRTALTARMIGRSVRPFFPEDLRSDVSVVCTVMSNDPDCPPELAALIGTSAALSVSDIPWNGPVSGVSVGYVDGGFVIGPNAEQRGKSRLNLTVVSSDSGVVVLEGGADEIPDDVLYAAVMAGHQANRPVLAFLKGIREEIGRKPFSYESGEPDEEMAAAVQAFAADDVREAFDTADKNIRDARFRPVTEKVHEKFDPVYPGQAREIDECLYRTQKYVMRRWLLDEQKRVDGREMDEIRPLAAEVGLLPRARGSALFTCGETQAFTAVTLGSMENSQRSGGDAQQPKRFAYRCSVPGYAVGSARQNCVPESLKLEYAAFAERALAPVMPSAEQFPGKGCLESDVLSSNGPAAQAAVCSSSLALMDAGVPIKAPVAGISCGLVAEGRRWAAITDIQELEASFGDMDFEAAGTRTGITALRMDLKTGGLTPDMLREILAKTHKALGSLLGGVILKTLPEPRRAVSPDAPKPLSVRIPAEKVSAVIGPGGRVLQKICAECGVRAEARENGEVLVSGAGEEACRRAAELIKTVVRGPEPGAIYKGKVTRLTGSGTFVEIIPGREGLVPPFKRDGELGAPGSDPVRVGDEVMVKVMNLDEKGRIRLSRRAARMELDGSDAEPDPRRPAAT